MRLFLALSLFFIYTSVVAKTIVIGDLEGDIYRLESFLKDHPHIFEYNSDGWRVLPRHKFVFMGDAVDRGVGSIRIVRILKELKKNSPDSVSLILGNRDINKLWVNQIMLKYKNKKIPEFLRKVYINYLNKYENAAIDLDTNLSRLNEMLDGVDNEVLRLKVVLNGMNAADAFENRKFELKALFPHLDITDKFVYEHFIRDWSTGGEFHSYLKQGQIAKIIDNTVYTHGAITAKNYGYIPNSFTREDSIHSWINKLNRWGMREISLLEKNPTYDSPLIEYHKRRQDKFVNNESVMYARYSDATGNAKAPNFKFVKKLNRQGIQRIVVGHTPVGEFAHTLKVPGMEIVLTDVSYAQMTKLPYVEIQKDKVRVQTLLNDGTVINSTTNLRNNLLPTGYKLNDGRRVIGKIMGTDFYKVMKITQVGRVFSSHYSSVTVEDIFKIGLKVDSNKSKSHICVIPFKPLPLSGPSFL